MAIDILKQPPAVAFAGNPVIYKFQSYAALATTGDYAEFSLTFGEWPALDETIRIQYAHPEGNVDQTFIFKASPDESGIQLLRSTIYTLSAYVDLLILNFKANYSMFRHWNIEKSGTDKIVFRAKEYGYYNPTITESSSKISSLISNPGEDLVQQAGFRIIVETYKSTGNVLLGTDLVQVDNSGIGEIDLSDYLRALFDNMFTFPQDGTVKITEKSWVESVYVRIGNYYGSPAVAKKMTALTAFKTLAGGIGKQRLAILNDLSTDLYTMIAQYGLFLTWQPIRMDVDARMPHSLFWLNTTVNTTLKLMVKAYYTNGNSVTYTAYSKTGCSKDKIYEFIVNPTKLFEGITLTTYTGHFINKYDLWVADGSSVAISQIRTFDIDYAAHTHVRYFRYRNSLGVYDTIRCTGVFQKMREFDVQSINGVLDSDFGQDDFESRNINATTVEVFKGNTGFFDKYSEYGQWMSEAMAELALSDKVYEITDEGLVPVKITPAKMVISTDNANLYSFDFEYQKTYTDTMISNILDSGRQLQTSYFGSGFGSGFIHNPTQVISNPIGQPSTV